MTHAFLGEFEVNELDFYAFEHNMYALGLSDPDYVDASWDRLRAFYTSTLEERGEARIVVEFERTRDPERPKMYLASTDE